MNMSLLTLDYPYECLDPLASDIKDASSAQWPLDRRFMQRPTHPSFGWVTLFWTNRNITGQAVDG